MKLKEISLMGFRGFNGERSIPIHERLTLISAPNSHGKTSISEGFEWLLFGYTSKVAFADSKDEYRGSYRNIHLLQPLAPTVRVVVQEGTVSTELQATMSGADAVLRVNGVVVSSWPFAADLDKATKPFILQHALKDLLLAAPVDRFNRFAALLGFDELTHVHKDLMAFCTRPPIPDRANVLVADIDSLGVRLAADPQLVPIVKSIRKGYSELAATLSLVRKHARALLPPNAPDSDLLGTLAARRDEAIAKVFSGSVAVSNFTTEEAAALKQEEAELITLVTLDAVALLTEMVRESARHKIIREAEFYAFGVERLIDLPTVCPFCAQPLTEADVKHIHDRHFSSVDARQAAVGLEAAETELEKILRELGQRISEYYKRTASPTKGLIDAKEARPQLEALLAEKHAGHLTAIINAAQEIGDEVSRFVEKGKEVRSALKEIDVAIRQPVSELTLVEQLGQALIRYLAAGSTVREVIAKHASALEAANRVLIEQLNSIAGTKTLSLMIELLENERKLDKRLRIGAAIDELKGLKAEVDSFVMKIMLDAISGELADEVMEWYRRIRTIGDPDVHFSGFDMKKTPQGGRVQIKATSYGKDLVSAVSSLSESKLNALGLCISIAINLKNASLFEFLIIDDPIQSWDKDHELQFIGVIRELVERGKQVLLLSHNGEWIKQVRSTCADLDGLYYEITGYTDDGPVIKQFPWVEPKQRLQTILAIIEDQNANSIRLQQAEEELRQVLHQFTCTLFEAVKGISKNPATLNADRVRKLLTECGIDLSLLNKVMSIFDTLDNAHHASPGYSPNRQKLRQYYNIAVRLSQAIDGRLKEGRTMTVVRTGKTA